MKKESLEDIRVGWQVGGVVATAEAAALGGGVPFVLTFAGILAGVNLLLEWKLEQARRQTRE